MTQDQVIAVLQDAIRTVLLCSFPMIGVGLVIGIIVSIFQAATQINEQTLSFVPKIVGILLALLVFGGFIFSTMSEFTNRMFGYINSWIF